MGKVDRKIIYILIFFLLSPLCLNSTEVSAYSGEPDKITFVLDGQEITYTLQELYLQIDSFGPEGYGMYCTDPNGLRHQLIRLGETLYKAPVSAQLIKNEEGDYHIVPEQIGREMDLSALIMWWGGFSIYQEKYPLPVKELLPMVTEDELRNRLPQTLWAEYSTVLADIPDRTENVKLAAAKLQGLLVIPGQEFSFNETVGPREMEEGFREAKIIVGGKFENGMGGGICQVSSTLYNTLLLAGLQISERHNHSLQIAYVPLGRDATVVYGQKDLKFKNTTNCVLRIKTRLEGLKLTIGIYGSGKNPFSNIKITHKVLKTYPFTKEFQSDPSLVPGQQKILVKGQDGYLVETYRSILKGTEMKNELVSRDYYAPVNQVVGS